MDLFSDIISTIQNDLTVGDESTLFDLDTIKLAVNRAYRKIGGLFKWPELRDALKTSTIADHEYYDYPQNWRPDSIWKLTVDGIDYGDPLVFKDYLYEQENNYPSGLKNIWANQRLRYFITPIPTVDGDMNITIHGFRVVDKLLNDSDITIFSYSLPEVNEAIVLESTAILKQKGEIQQILRRQYISGSELLSTQAISIVTGIWSKIAQDQAKNEKTTAMFDVPDFFPSGRHRGILQYPTGRF